jgi:hypothetical protein
MFAGERPVKTKKLNDKTWRTTKSNMNMQRKNRDHTPGGSFVDVVPFIQIIVTNVGNYFSQPVDLRKPGLKQRSNHSENAELDL